MNAPSPAPQWQPYIKARAVPETLLEALQTRFAAQFSTALAVREQHGRDESAFSVPPPCGRGVCLEHTRCK